eukprot:jgi/Chlat1/8354/Chrsp80S07785
MAAVQGKFTFEGKVEHTSSVAVSSGGKLSDAFAELKADCMRFLGEYIQRECTDTGTTDEANDDMDVPLSDEEELGENGEVRAAAVKKGIGKPVRKKQRV